MAQPKQQSALVVGLGLTGLSCVRYLAAQGYQVSVTDTRAQPPRLAALQQEFPHVPVHTGALSEQVLEGADMLVLSPGVSPAEPAIAAYGKTAIGDVELFARALPEGARVIAITGSNGKSTVTALVGAMCRAARCKTLVGGNIGVPVLDLLDQPPAEVYVVELSSFQLETTYSLNPTAAAVLNITPDHLDRYPDLESYAHAKERIFTGDGAMVLNRDDPLVMEMQQSGRRILSFGYAPPKNWREYGIVTRSGVDWLARDDELIISGDKVALPGRHNLVNVLAAMALASTVEIPVAAMQHAIKSFHGLPHRSQVVTEHAGVLWINDSKGTNVGAAVAALNGMARPVILIAGGDGKGADFGPLRRPVLEHARAVILLGRDAPRIEEALAGTVPIHHVADMPAAVARAHQLARSGDAVLLSPACASFDMFRNYEHRGDAFTTAVMQVTR